MALQNNGAYKEVVLMIAVKFRMYDSCSQMPQPFYYFYFANNLENIFCKNQPRDVEHWFKLVLIFQDMFVVEVM